MKIPEFWLYQGSDYTSGSQYARVLNIPEFWICKGSENASGSECAWVLNLPYAWMIIECLIMVEYARIHVNMPKCFLDETKFDIFYSSWKYLICFLLNTFTSKILNLIVPFRAKGPKAVTVDINRINRETFILYPLFLISLLSKGLLWSF